MSEPSLLDVMEDWGYYLSPKTHPDSPGYPSLYVAIRKQPTRRHFDPELIRLRLCDKYKLAKWTKLRLEPPFIEDRSVCPGRVILLDRVGKSVHFFTFGGLLTAATTVDETVYSLCSPAPILKIVDEPWSISGQLAFEVETLLGKYQAAWGLNDSGFAQRLTQIDPLRFYQASLQRILQNYRQSMTLREHFVQFYQMLLKETDWLSQHGQGLTSPPNLKELLGPRLATAEA
jgi:hypothetical protein